MYLPSPPCTSLNSSPSPSPSSKSLSQHNLATLFHQLSSLQQHSESQQAHRHQHLLQQFHQQEGKTIGKQQLKAGHLSSLLKALSEVQRQMEHQRSEEERMRRGVKTMMDGASLQVQQGYQQLQKERLKSENSLQQWVQGKLQSFYLKHKGSWGQHSLVEKAAWTSEISHLQRTYSTFLTHFGKEVQKSRQQSATYIQELTKYTETEIRSTDEEHTTSFLTTIHAEINSRLQKLAQQRLQTEQKVLSVLERVASSCLSEGRLTC